MRDHKPQPDETALDAALAVAAFVLCIAAMIGIAVML